MKLPKKEEDKNKKISTKLKIVIAILDIVITSIIVITTMNKLDDSIPELISYENELSEVTETISGNTFYGKEVYIVTTIQTLEIESYEKNGLSYNVKTHYGNIETNEDISNKECITVYKSIDNKLEEIGSIKDNENINYVIDGYKRVKSDTLIIKSDTNKKKYREYINLIDKAKDIREKQLLENEKWEQEVKGVIIYKQWLGIIWFVSIIFIVGDTFHYIKEKEKI